MSKACPARIVLRQILMCHGLQNANAKLISPNSAMSRIWAAKREPANPLFLPPLPLRHARPHGARRRRNPG